MRWKLACGGVVGTTKQPVQNKDFDRLVIVDITCDATSLESANIILYNPSTHLKRLAHSGRLVMGITQIARKNAYHPYRGLAYNHWRILNLVSGANQLQSYINYDNYFMRDNIHYSPGQDFYDNSWYAAKHQNVSRPIYRLNNPREFGPGYDQHGNPTMFSTGYGYPNDWMNVTFWSGYGSKYHQCLLLKKSKEVTVDY